VVQDFESMTMSDDPSHVGAAKKTDARAEEWKDDAANEMGSSGATYSKKLKNVAVVPTEYGKKLTSVGKQNEEHAESMPGRTPAPHV
jgi:hypothetical protein